MKRKSKGKGKGKGSVRRIRVRGVVAFPAVSVALVAAVALALTPFGPSQVMAFAAASTPAEATATATVVTDTPAPTSTTSPAPVATTTEAPAPSSTTTQAPAPSSSPSLTPSPAPQTSPTPQGVPAPAAAFGDHHILALIPGPGLEATYLPSDTDVTHALPFQTFRVRFKLHNAGTDSTTAAPQLEYRPNGDAGYTVVPEKAAVGVPFHIVREWVPSLGLSGGTMQGPASEDIAVSDFRMGTEGGLALTGHHSMSANPDQPITLPSDSYTEQEFTVELTMDAKYLTGYQLRITDGLAPLSTDLASISLGSPPAVSLSPGQRQGVAVVDPKPTSVTGVAFPLVPVTSATTVSAVSTLASPSTVGYALTASTLTAATLASSDIHGPYSLTADQCATCHSGHRAQTPNLLVKGSQSSLCFTCHDGTAADANVQDQYAVARPNNDPAERDYYSHDALSPSTHTRAELDEFGSVSNRHSECADCHNSHKARTTDSTQTADGWDVSGRLAGVSGVSVTNGAAGEKPTTYEFLDGVTKPVTREYQLCFKCHSGTTALLPPIPGKPSKDMLDKAVELNPANPSFHPVEAAGKNQTPMMQASLDGGSPYKLWNFNTTSTVRCLNCHAGGKTDPTATSPLPLPGSALEPHASSNRGILLENYRDRVLKPSDTAASATDAAYSAGDFALCYVCHGEKPFANATGDAASTATNFSLHGKHLTGLAGKGDGGTDIDKAGDGQGNALCAECHFRIHSTTNKVGAQQITGSRLVNFAPNVQPVVPGGTLSWAPGSGTTGGGSCTLTCHGYSHTGAGY